MISKILFTATYLILISIIFFYTYGKIKKKLAIEKARDSY